MATLDKDNKKKKSGPISNSNPYNWYDDVGSWNYVFSDGFDSNTTKSVILSNN